MHTQSPLCMCAAVHLCARAFLIHYTSCAATERTRTLTRTSHAHTRSLCIHEQAVHTQSIMCTYVLLCVCTHCVFDYTSFVEHVLKHLCTSTQNTHAPHTHTRTSTRTHTHTHACSLAFKQAAALVFTTNIDTITHTRLSSHVRTLTRNARRLAHRTTKKKEDFFLSYCCIHL